MRPGRAVPSGGAGGQGGRGQGAGGGGGQPPVIVGKSALFASRCPFSDAKSSAAAGCPSDHRTAPSPLSNLRLRTAMPGDLRCHESNALATP